MIADFFRDQQVAFPIAARLALRGHFVGDVDHFLPVDGDEPELAAMAGHGRSAQVSASHQELGREDRAAGSAAHEVV
jgi:hypothetical protein